MVQVVVGVVALVVAWVGVVGVGWGAHPEVVGGVMVAALMACWAVMVVALVVVV